MNQEYDGSLKQGDLYVSSSYVGQVLEDVYFDIGILLISNGRCRLWPESDVRDFGMRIIGSQGDLPFVSSVIDPSAGLLSIDSHQQPSFSWLSQSQGHWDMAAQGHCSGALDWLTLALMLR